MSDPNLIAFGCGVALISLAGVYVFVRERFVRPALPAAPGFDPHEVITVLK